MINSTDTAKTAAMEQYTRDFEHAAVQEQLLRTIDPGVARPHHDAALILVNAIDFEDKNPDPPEPPPWCDCQTCSKWMARVGKA